MKSMIDHRRVFVVLSSLVASMSVSTGVLMMLEGKPITSATVQSYLLSALTPIHQDINSLVTHTNSPLQTSRWNYIIIYQSGNMSGDAADLMAGRLRGGVSGSGNPENVVPGANFHFVVDNNVNGDQNPDGFIEVGSVWKNQEATAPDCSWPYYHNHTSPQPYTNAIGVCLVGNVDSSLFSEAQMSSTLALVKTLQNKFNIPDSQVICQWAIRPGSNISPNQESFSASFSDLLKQ
jgi:N-acetylmuramoyl-L-alanine amidase